MEFVFNILNVVLVAADEPAEQSLPLPAIVVSAFAVLFVLYVYIMKAIRSKSAPAEAAPAPAAPAPAAKSAGVPMPAGMTQGELELIDTDEKTAAVIMAIVSDKSGIPLNRLAFKSIKLMEDNK